MALNDSHEISKATKQRVRDEAARMRYVRNGIAVDLQRRKTDQILFITEDPARPYFADAIDTLERATSAFGFDLIISTANAVNRQRATHFLYEQRADAIICWSSFISNDALNQTASVDRPIFVYGRDPATVTNPNVYNIQVQRERAGYEITDYLIRRGFRQLLFVHSGTGSLGSTYRRDGFVRAAEQHPQVTGSIIEAEDATYESGYRITRDRIFERIRGHGVDAIIYANDDMAVGGLRFLISRDIRVPQDISVAGYDNYPIGTMIWPTLTTVDLHERDVMSWTATLLQDLIVNGVDPSCVQEQAAARQFVSEVVERDSVRKEHAHD